MSDLLISFNEKNFQSYLLKIEECILFFADSIFIFNKMGIGTFEKKNFLDFFVFPEEFLYESIMANKPLEIAGIPVNKQKLFQLLQLPDGYYKLIADIKAFQARVGQPQFLGKGYTIETFLDWFEFDKNDNIQLKQEYRKSLLKENQKLIRSEEAKNLFNFLTELSTVLNKTDLVNKIAPPPFYSLHQFINRFMPFDSDVKKWKINNDLICSFDNGMVSL